MKEEITFTQIKLNIVSLDVFNLYFEQKQFLKDVLCIFRWLHIYLWSDCGPTHQLFIHPEAPLAIVLEDAEVSHNNKLVHIFVN